MSKNFPFLALAFSFLTLPALAQDFRVQAAAFADSVPMAYFKTRGVEKVLLSHDQMGLYRYFVGTYNTREEAAKVQADLVGKGFPNAAIIDLAEQRILCGANCPYFRENMIFVQDSNVYNIFFDFGRYSLTADAKTELNKVFEAMRSDLKTKLTLLGHTDGIGNKEANLRLSANRARSARNYLLNKGIRSERMSIKIFGESDPITPNTDIDNTDRPEARKLNRRVTLALRDEKGEIKAAEKK
jgi:outer membrane protein OmpA-like peptidoglycan-associated protein